MKIFPGIYIQVELKKQPIFLLRNIWNFSGNHEYDILDKCFPAFTEKGNT